MPAIKHPHLEKRLSAILSQLHAVHAGGAPAMATRGAEREAFVELLLRGCMPATYRFGSGEVTDAYGNTSGQIDVVIEHPFIPSFPMLGTSQHRLYLVEGIAVAIEVKSSEGQFGEAVESMRKFREVVAAADWPTGASEKWIATGSGGPTSFPDRIGFAIVMYQGWAKAETLAEHCRKDDVDVALQFDPPIFYARNYRQTGKERIVEGTAALAAFLFTINEELRALMDVNSELFRRYVDQVAPGV